MSAEEDRDLDRRSWLLAANRAQARSEHKTFDAEALASTIKTTVRRARDEGLVALLDEGWIESAEEDGMYRLTFEGISAGVLRR